MMDYILLTGIWGGLITVLGGAYPEERGHPIYSTKNWLLAMGALILLGYAALNYFFGGGSLFFVMLELLIIVASVMMMLDVDDKTDAIVLSIIGLGFVIWSFFLYEGLSTIYFIIGLTGVALGYALKTGTVQRFLAFTLGSVLLTAFSYLGADWVFFGLNAFFSVFSAFYLIRILRISYKK